MHVDRYGEMDGTVAEFDFLELLGYALDGDRAKLVTSMRTNDEAGLLTSNVGMVVRLEDGSEFQVTVVQSGGERRYEDDGAWAD